jgi:hypothetical protein
MRRLFGITILFLTLTGSIIGNPYLFTSSWTPNSESSCFQWHESDTGITSGGNGVSQWDDQCDSGNDLSNSTDTDAERPDVNTGTTPDSVEYNNSANHLATAAYSSAKTQPVTFVFCFDSDDSSSEMHLVGSTNAASNMNVFLDNPDQEHRMDAGGTEAVGSDDTNTLTVAMYEFDNGSNTCKSWLNGTADINTTACGTENHSSSVLGNFSDTNSVGFDGNMFYFAAYEAALDTSTKNLAGNHAADYCGGTWSDL